MSISTLLSTYFSVDAIDRGNRLFWSAKVEAVYSTDDFFHALSTERSGRQSIVVEVTEEDVGVHCSCETFRTDDLCPHLWGALLVAEEKGALGNLNESNAEVTSLSEEEAAAVIDEIEERSMMDQTIYCDLDPMQRQLYDQLCHELRPTLMRMITERGIRGPASRVIDAFLQLRRTANHLGLIDPKRRSGRCPKFDILLPRLIEFASRGDGSVVFSQLPDLLKILRTALRDNQVAYEYLDETTTSPQACIDRFQTHPEISVLLISREAGDIGLDPMAASRLYLLDPWWNPAVAMQGINPKDPTGQKRSRGAQRLIARDTIEEGILALQNEKRGLADAIITGDSSRISDMSREDLATLLG